VIDVSRLLHPDYFIVLVIGHVIRAIGSKFTFSIFYNFINLINNNINLMSGKFMEIPLRRHHHKGGNNDLTVKHKPDEFNVVVAIFFPQIISRNVRQFGQPLVDTDLVVLAELGEEFVGGDLGVYGVELLVVGGLFAIGLL
jgi:hypothetical protein